MDNGNASAIQPPELKAKAFNPREALTGVDRRMPSPSRRRRLKPALVLALWCLAFGIVAAALLLAIGILILAAAPLGIFLVGGFYLYWRREKRNTLFCPTCGRHYALEEGPVCREDHTELKSVF